MDMDTFDMILNLAIFIVTAGVILSRVRTDGKYSVASTRKALRFFTQQSNILCGISALLMAFFAKEEWAWMLKYTGTAAVTVTMLTVFLFLRPSIGKGWQPILLGREGIFTHLLLPVTALLTFCVLERRSMSFLQALAGMLPILYYGPLYIWKTVYAPEKKRWEDFYGFNRGGKWPLAVAGMLAGGFLICMVLMAIQNL